MSAPLHHISTLPADHTVTITDPHGATVATFTLTQPARLTIAQQNTPCDMQQCDTQPSCKHADALRMEHVSTYIIDLDDLDDTVPEVAQLSSALDAFLTATGNIDAGDARATQRDNEYSDEAFKDLEALRKHATPRNTNARDISADKQTSTTHTTAGNITTVITPSNDAYCIVSEYAFADAIEFAQCHALTTRVAIEHDEYGYTTYTGVPQLRSTDFIIELTDDLTGATLELIDTTAPEYTSGTILDNRTIRELIFWSHPTNNEYEVPQQPVSVPFDTFVQIVESQQKDNGSSTTSTRNRTAPQQPRTCRDEQIALGNVTTVITVRDDINHTITASAFADIIRFAQQYGLTVRVAIEHGEYGHTVITGVPQRRIDCVIDITDQLTGTIIELVDTTAPAYASGALPDMDTITELAIWSNPTFGETGNREVPAVVPFSTFVEVVKAHHTADNSNADDDVDTNDDAVINNNNNSNNTANNTGRITITADILNGIVEYVDRGTQEPIDEADVITAIMLAYDHELAVHATFRVPSFGLTAYQGTIANGAQYGKNPNALFAIDPRVGGAEVIAPDGTLAPDMRHLAQLTIYADDRAKEYVDTTPPLDIATFVDIVRNNACDDNAHATHNTDDTASSTPATLTAADLDTVDTVFNELIGSGIAFSAIAHMDKYHMCALRTTHGDFVDVSHVNDRYDAAQILDILADAADKTLSVIAVFASPYAEENYIGKLKWDNDENELFISDNSRGDVVIAYLDENDEFCAEDVFAELSYIRVFSDAKMRRNGFAGTNDAQYDLVPVAAFRDKL